MEAECTDPVPRTSRQLPVTPIGSSTRSMTLRKADIAPRNATPSPPSRAKPVGAADWEPRPALRQPLNHCVNRVHGRLG